MDIHLIQIENSISQNCHKVGWAQVFVLCDSCMLFSFCCKIRFDIYSYALFFCVFLLDCPYVTNFLAIVACINLTRLLDFLLEGVLLMVMVLVWRVPML